MGSNSVNDLREGALRQFSGREVTLGEGRFSAAFEKAYAYYMNLSLDDMLFELRAQVGIPNPAYAHSLKNEEGTWFGLGGNVLGQWLQAYPRFYAVTGRVEAKEKADAFVDGLYEIYSRNRVFCDGLFMYFFEKYLRGLTDCWTLCGNARAFEMARGFLEAAMASPIYRDASLYLGDNGPGNEIEWYTISESIYCFADAAQAAGASEEDVAAWRVFAEKFEYQKFWNIFLKEDDLFHYSPLAGQNTAYFHAYSHLNSFNSAACAYRVKGDPDYLNAIQNFYAFMRGTQELATGGYGAHLEWLMPRTGMINAMRSYHDSFETQCDCYAVYRLSNFLLGETGDGAYGNWTERLFYNGTLASIDMDEKGHVMYYSDYCTQGGRKHLHPNTWTCCTGTRPLLLCELKRTVFFHDGQNLYVNLFTPASVTLDGFRLEQTGDLCEGDTLGYSVSAPEGVCRRVSFRRPEWLEAEPCLTRNGKSVKLIEQGGWLTSECELTDGDRLELTLPKPLTVHRLESMGAGVAAINYGPLTLALERREGVDPSAAVDFSRPVREQLTQCAPREFAVKDRPQIRFRAYLDYVKGEEYYLCFETAQEEQS